MALIYVKRRKDPIKISNARAQAVKDAKFGNGNTPKADNEEFLDLGIWAGQFGEIVQIELDEVSVSTPPKSNEPSQEEMMKKEDDRLLSLSIEDRAEHHLKFISQWHWFGWSKMQEKEAPDDAKDFMRKKLIAFFKKYPNEPRVPNQLKESFKDHFFVGGRKSTD